MKKIFITTLCMCLVFASVAYAATGGGTAEEATALVDKAVARMQESGIDKAIWACNDPAGEFVVKDLYIFVVDMSGTVLAHGAKADLIGKNLMSLQDEDGKFIIKDMLEMAKTQPEGWVDYKWENPLTKSIDNKSTYFRKVKDVIVCCGVYR